MFPVLIVVQGVANSKSSISSKNASKLKQKENFHSVDRKGNN